MTRLSVLLASILAALPLISAFPAQLPEQDSAPTLPVDDPFYIPPEGFETFAPGTILRHRTPPNPIAALGFAKVNIPAAHQILYRTSDSAGNAIATVSTILIPNNADFSKLLSYQVAQDAADPNCSPSYALQLEAAYDGFLGLLAPQIDLLFFGAALEKGWVVTIPDHLGPKSAFLANTLSGHAVLDNVRAALASSSFTNITSDPTIALWGYSGGSLSSGFAAELQPTYAPELNIVGAALGGTVPRIRPVIDAVNKGPFVGLVPSGIQGLANEYPDIEQLLAQGVKPSMQADFSKTKHLCLEGDFREFSGKDIYEYTIDRTIFDQPVAKRIMDANAMGQNVPKIPLLVYKSVGDEISPVNDTDSLIEMYCQGGASVEYKRDLISEHISHGLTGSADAMLWIIDRMNNKPVQAGCTTSTAIAGLLDPKIQAALGQEISTLLKAILAGPIGPAVVG
ncbi:secretory lipase-domain-containing protein [Aspergillus bertholletiae]|uniref:Secretory lipase-domain-containing protein n=1 Tax=Aspergillus bertholletiae TaxID=1226010 RepID=A0A5N7BPZ5_9EURO|nr:secretory lipase-domain-containing protein [Aspergillus bertholletiae]